MSFWWIAVKDLLHIARDKKALLTLVMMPLLLIAILGAAFGNLMKQEGDVTIQKFTVGVVNQDEGLLGEVLAKDVLAEGMSEQIKIEEFQKNDLEAQIEAQKLSIGMIIPKDFSESIFAGEHTKIVVSTVPNPGIKATIVQSVIEQFAQTVAVETEAVKLVLSETIESGMPVDENIQSVLPTINNQEIEKRINQSLINEKTVKSETEPVGSFQYYSAAMGVMFLLMTIAEGVSAMILEKEQEVYKRLLVSRLSYGNYLFGKMLGLIVIGLLQSFMIILGTSLIFGVDWGESVTGIVFITIAFVISACGLGVLVGAFIQKEKTFNVTSMLGTQIMAVLGGSMVPLYLFPDWAVIAGKLLPNGLALQTYLDLMSGSSLIDILPAAGLIFGLGAVFFTIGLIRLMIERRGRYA